MYQPDITIRNVFTCLKLQLQNYSLSNNEIIEKEKALKDLKGVIPVHILLLVSFTLVINAFSLFALQKTKSKKK